MRKTLSSIRGFRRRGRRWRFYVFFATFLGWRATLFLVVGDVETAAFEDHAGAGANQAANLALAALGALRLISRARRGR